MDKRFPPPSEDQLMALYLRTRVVYEIAETAETNGDYAGLCAAEAYHKHLSCVFEAMLERQRGATVH